MERVAIALAREGCKVAIAGRRVEKLADVVRQFDGKPAIKTHEVDVADRRAWPSCSSGPIESWAGSIFWSTATGVNVQKRSIHDLSPEDWDRVMAINVTGAYDCIREVLPQMKERRDGLIVNINSTAGVRAGLIGGVAYNASKFAMKALGITVAQEVRELGIRVTNIYPGEVDTPILENRTVPVTAEHRPGCSSPRTWPPCS